jgi:hypothetical protein
MESNGNRKILIAIAFVALFAVVVIIWYFFYAKPVIGKNITETNNPLPVRQLKPRFQFLNWGNEKTSTSTTEVTDPLALPLIRVWDKPATGQTFITRDTLKEIEATSTIGTTTVVTKKTVRATSTTILFVDRTTGYVYGFPIETGTAYQISNTILPGIYDATIFEDGKKILMRYVDQDKNKIVGIIANIPNVQENEMPQPLTNVQYIPTSVLSIASSYKKDKTSYLTSTDTGSALFTITAKGLTLVTTSPFKEWTLAYGGDNLYVTSKPSAYVPGATFSIPTFQPEVPEKTGLTSKPTEGGLMINSMWSSQGLATFISNNGSLRMTTSKTLAEKCAWGEKRFLICAVPKLIPRGTEGLPDDWYQGRISFNDDFFALDSVTGESYPLYTFKKDEGIFDVTNITVAKGSTLISFNRKQDASLWLLNTALIESDERE